MSMHSHSRARRSERAYHGGMQISRGGSIAIGSAAVALFAVLVSYAPEQMKAQTAMLVASGAYAVDDWQSWDGGYADSYDYYESSYDYDYYGATPSSYGRGGYDYRDEYYYDEYYGDYGYDYYAPRTSAWGYGGSVSPFPALTSVLNGMYPLVQSRPVVISNPNYTYMQQPVAVPSYRQATPPTPAPMPQPQPQPRLPQPSCSIVANPYTVSAGGATTLTWGSQYGTQATLDAVGSVSPNGSHTISNITTTRTYGLAVTGPGGTGACYALVSVRAPAQQMTCLISTNPVIIYQGQSATLAWGSTNAVSATLSGGGSQGAVPVSGAITITPHISTNYTIALRDGAGNTQSCTTGIIVQ